MKRLIFFSLILIFSQSEKIFSQDGFRINLIKNLNPQPSGDFTYSALWGYTSPDGREYAILGSFYGTSFIDITDSNNIREVDFLGLPPGVDGIIYKEMKTYSHYCYIVSEAFGSKIQIVDLQYLPDSIRYVGLSDIPGHSTTHTISQSGHYLYLNGCNPSLSTGVIVVDIENPELPVVRGRWDDLYVHDSRIVNDTIWACNINGGKISIIDATNKDSLRTVRSWVNNPAPNVPHNIAFTTDRNYAFVTDEASAGKLKIWNVSDLENITYITSFNPYPFESSVVHNVETNNNNAFLAYYSAGVKVLDISTPENPVELGWFDTHPESNTGSGGCWAVYHFPSGKLIASDKKRGLFVLRPDLSKQIIEQPRVNFTKDIPEVVRIRTIRMIDMTEGLPASWSWRITGPETQTSNLRHPDFIFNKTGYYTVSLRAANSHGTDSLVRSDFFKVTPAPLSTFQVIHPSGNPPVLIQVSPTDTSRVFFNWQRSSTHPDITYKIYFKKIFGPAQSIFSSGNNGTDTFHFARKSFLDSMAVQFGLEGDSVRVLFRSIAYNGHDSIVSSNSKSLILKRTGTGVLALSEHVPSEYKLHNNYPNPFNPVTKIKFDIPFSGNVTLKIFDISGKEIITILDEFKQAGVYSAEFDGSNLSSGIYFYKLESGKFAAARKFVLLK